MPDYRPNPQRDPPGHCQGADATPPCQDEDCPCCLGSCNHFGDPYEPPRLPEKSTRHEPGTPGWSRVVSARRRRGEAIHHPEDAPPTDLKWIKKHGRAAD